MVTRRGMLGSLVAGVAGSVGAAGRVAALGFPLGAERRIEAPYPDVRLDATDGTLVAAATDDDTGTLTARDVTTGERLWRRSIDGPTLTPVATAEGVWLVSAGALTFHRGGEGQRRSIWSPEVGRLHRPVPVGDGVVAVHTVTTGGGPLQRGSTTSTLRRIRSGAGGWSADVLGEATRPAVDEDLVVVATVHRGVEGLDAGRIVAFATDDGERRWRAEGVRTDHRPVLIDGEVVVGDRDGVVRGLAAGGGSEEWRVGLEGAVASMHASPVQGEALARLDDGRLVGVDPSEARPTWRYEPAGPIDGVAVVGDVVLSDERGDRLTALRPPDDGVVWRETVRAINWPPVAAGDALHVGGRRGTIRSYPSVEEAARARIDDVADDSRLSPLDPLAEMLGYDQRLAAAKRAYREGAYRRAHRLASAARRRRWAAGGIAMLGGLVTLGGCGVAADRARLTWRRRRTLASRHATVEERVAALEADLGDPLPGVRRPLEDAAPGLVPDGDRVREALADVERLVDVVETASDRRSRLRERLEALREAPIAESDAVPTPLDALEAGVEAADPCETGEPRGIRRCDRRLRTVERAVDALEAIDPAWFEATFTLDEGTLAGLAPDRAVRDVADADGPGDVADALERLAALAGDDRLTDDATALTALDDADLVERYGEAVRRADVDALETVRSELDRRRRVADRRQALLDRGSDAPIGGLTAEAIRAAVERAAAAEQPGARLRRLETLDRAVDVGERLERCERRGGDGRLETLRERLGDAVDGLDDDAVAAVEEAVEAAETVLERAEEIGAMLDRLDLDHTDHDPDAIRERVREAVDDRDPHRLGRLLDRLRRAERRTWSRRRVTALPAETFEAVVGDLWSTFGYDVSHGDGEVVARQEEETVLVLPCPFDDDRPVRRDDVERGIEAREASGGDRLLVVTSSRVAEGARATAEHGWSDVGFVEGDDLAELLDESSLVPPE